MTNQKPKMIYKYDNKDLNIAYNNGYSQALKEVEEFIYSVGFNDEFNNFVVDVEDIEQFIKSKQEQKK